MSSLSENSILRGSKYNYRIEKVLGQGSFGMTYKAKVILSGDLGELNSAITVAVKEFFMRDLNIREGDAVITGANQPLFYKYRKNFIREAEHLSRLSHPNIIKVLEFFEANNTAYYSMEFIKGGDLEEYINGRGWLTEKEALGLMADILGATECMHRNFMLHLDLKPLNIMMRDGREPVLIDFGLSKQFTDSGHPESSTTIGAGTVGYAPIEQWSYKKEDGFSPTLDIYALGATLYKMLSGLLPPDALSILNDGFPEHELLKKGVNPDIIFMIKSAMDPYKKNRYQTVGDFLRAINFLIANASTEKVENPDFEQEPFKTEMHSDAAPTCELEFVNGMEIHWHPYFREEQKAIAREWFKYLQGVHQNYKLTRREYDGEMVRIGDRPRSFCEYSHNILKTLGKKWPYPTFPINKILDLILELSHITGIPFRLAYIDEIRYMTTIWPESTEKPYEEDSPKTICLSQNEGMVYFKGDSHSMCRQVSTADLGALWGFTAHIATDFKSPIVRGNSFDIPFTQSFPDETVYIGFNLFKTRNGSKWNIKSPLNPMKDYLPENFDTISNINIISIPGGGPLSASNIFFGIEAKKGDYTYYYKFDNKTFELIKKLSQREIDELSRLT